MATTPDAATAHPTATEHLPGFITAPGETDVLMVVMWGVLAGSVLAFGILFLRLHTLPERIAHRTHKLQFEIVAVLGLIALFTHMHIFWVAGLLLALVDLPDFGTPLNRIAGSAEKIVGLPPGGGVTEMPLDTVDDSEHAGEAVEVPHPTKDAAKPSEASPARPDLTLASKRS